jgi:hypothetical protein
MIKLSPIAAKAVNEPTDPAREQVSVEQVTDYDHEVDKTIDEFNRRGICLMDYSSEIRHRSFELESELTQAANRDDREAFFKLLADYRNCFN